jgi:membrane associated rhomboid family serine protease
MLYHEQSEDYRPLFWMSGRPIYANTLMVLAHVISFVICALCISYYGLSAVYNSLSLDTTQIWHGGQVWRLVSYIAFDPYFFWQRSLWFLWSMLLLYFFGREVEQFAGRKAYLKLYAALVLIPAILLCLLGLFIAPQTHLNCFEAIFGMFVAFATMYPGAMPSMWLPFPASVLTWILLAVFSLVDLADHAFTAIFMLWASSAVGFLGMRLIGVGHGTMWLTDWIEERRSRRLAQKHNLKVLKDTQATESIDEILEKISKQGVGSLNAKERAALERARTNLLKRDQR